MARVIETTQERIAGIDRRLATLEARGVDLSDYVTTTELSTELANYSLTTHNHDAAYAAIGHNHDGTYAKIVEEGELTNTNQTSLSAQQSYVNVGLDKTFSGLDAAKTYRLHVHVHVSVVTALNGTDHKYASRWYLNGSNVSAALGEAQGTWGRLSSSRVVTFTGVTSYTVDFLVYSYEATGTGRVYWRNLSYTLYEV